MKISSTFLKYFGLFLIVATCVAWPIMALTIAKEEPPVVLGLSFLALIFTGLAFYSASQDGEDIDEILDNQATILHRLDTLLGKDDKYER